MIIFSRFGNPKTAKRKVLNYKDLGKDWTLPRLIKLELSKNQNDSN